MDFNDYWQKIRPAPRYENRKPAARIEWNAHPEKHEAIMNWLNKHGAYPERNPYFFILDFTVPRGAAEPKDYNGTPELESVRDHSRIACYNGHWGIYTFEDIKLFNLQTKD